MESTEQELELPTRWEIELEFVQSLCNVQYLSFLAQNEYFSNPEFLNYLKYLNYWREPQYAKYLVYPNCLHILTLLQSPEFRKGILDVNVINMVSNDMYDRWTKGPVPVMGEKTVSGEANGTGTETEANGQTTDAVRDMDIDEPDTNGGGV